MKWFNIDLHVSTITDMQSIFSNLGHQIDDWSLSNHTWVLGKEKSHIPLLDYDNWHNIVKKELWNDFYDLYKSILNEYDGFIACYCPVFAMLYKKFNKPIIINTPIRYEHPLSFNPEEWSIFNDFVRSGIDDGTLTFVANNLYDKYYAEVFLNRPVHHIPSLCEYTKTAYVINNNPFIYYSRQGIEGISNKAVHLSKALPGRFYPKDLLNFRGIIHFPYQISTMSIFEQYTANIPLFFPSIKFLMKLYTNGTNVLKEVSWNNYFNGPSKSSLPFSGLYDPNNYRDLDSVLFWLRYADFYDTKWMPHVTLFDSVEELNGILETVNVGDISRKMKKTNEDRHAAVYSQWSEILKKVAK